MAVKLLAIKGYALVFLYMETGYNRAAKQTNLAYRNVSAGFVDSGKALPSLLKHGMTKMKTSNIQKHFRPTILAAAIFGISFTAQAVTVSISNKPLTGVTVTHGPNITLTPSVEYPTAGAAYSDGSFMDGGYPTLKIDGNVNNPQWKTRYLGYFDNTKCYKFSSYDDFTVGFFYVSSQASTDAAGRVGLCSGTDEEYSGNFLNWATMSAIDIFRHTLTGGNRAFGIGNSRSNYQKGDSVTETYLRRAYVADYANGHEFFRLSLRSISVGNSQADRDFLKRIIPASMAYSFPIPSQQAGLARAMGFKYLSGPNAGERVSSSETVKTTNRIFFYNDRFTVQPVMVGSDNALWFQDRGWISPSEAPSSVRSIVDKAADSIRGKHNINYSAMPVVVEVCKPSRLGASSLPSYCRQYGSNYKPEGLMQQYGRGIGPDSRPARFAVFGYQLADTNNVSGGVLRARMKYLDRTQTQGSVVYGQEWDENTGVFVLNPDTYDSGKTNVENSGAINYINKFGDLGRYKIFDSSAELFYTAQRYLRNKGMPAYYEQTQKNHGINLTSSDNFPMIYDWDDPLTRGLASPDEAQCRSNTMILIGDTFTHDEKDLPNFVPESGVTDDPEIKTKDILEKILDQEKFKGYGASTWNWTRGYGGRMNIPYSPAGLVALAYWGRTTDIRDDVKGTQYINTFTIDVLENGRGRFEESDPDAIGNTYYWAAKYGGFAYAPGSVNMPNDSRSSWTGETEGNSSSPWLFPQGMPKNFALGNNPENMVDALKKAFETAGSYTDPSQAFVGITEHQNSVVDIAANKTLGLQSSYNVDKLSGDVIAQRISHQGNGLTFTPAWRASTQMETFHTSAGWSARKLFTEAPNGTTTAFTPANVSQFSTELNAGTAAASLVQYTLGDPSLEGTAWRKRENGLIGTIINSGVQPILPPQSKPAACNYANSNVMVRKNFYVTASNAGVLHVLNENGQEVMGYIPSTALPKLYSLSLPVASHVQPIHQYLNDGTPVTDEVCFGSTAKSIVVGTAGRGGASVYALDVTDLSNPGIHNVMWEFSNADDPDLGLTVGKPSIAKDKDGNPIVIFSSGVNSGSSNGYLYILRADNTGNWQLNTNYWKVPLGQDGVGEPTVYDRDGDKMPEAVFVGDLSGKMWRVDYDKTNGSWVKSYGNQPLYTPSGTGAPITAAPVITQTGGHLYVVAGTGQYFSLADIAPSVQNYALGFFAEKGPITDADLLEQNFIGNGEEVDAAYSTNKDLTQRIYQVSQNAIESKHKGWRLSLLKGQAIVDQPGIRRNKVATFTAVRTTPAGAVNVCSVNGSTSLIAVNLQNGGQYNMPAFDTNKDGRFDDSDKLGGMLEIGGILAPVNTSREANVNGSSSIRNILAGDTATVDVPMNTFEDSLIRRISWREIF